jgi:outer membrane lipoprotein-sorting protein
MKKITLLLLLVVPFYSLHAQNVNEILGKINSEAKSLNSYKADFSIAFVQKNGEITEMGGEISYVKPDKMKMKLGMKGMPNTNQLMVSDGNTMWQYMPFMKIVSKVDLASLKKEFGQKLDFIKRQSKIENTLTGLKQETLQFVGIEKKDGVDCYVLEGVITDKKRNELDIPLKVTKAKVWIGKDDGLQRRTEFYDKSGDMLFYQELKNVKTNISIPDNDFKFQPPEGVNILDSTPQAREMLKKKRENQEKAKKGLQ